MHAATNPHVSCHYVGELVMLPTYQETRHSLSPTLPQRLLLCNLRHFHVCLTRALSASAEAMPTSRQIQTRLQAALAGRSTRSTTAAQHASGTDRHLIQKWSKRLQDSGSVFDAPRSSRPKAEKWRYIASHFRLHRAHACNALLL